MARPIDELPPYPSRPRPLLYPFHEWADGRPWVALYGEDYQTPHASFRGTLASHARRNGLHLSTRSVYEDDEQIGLAFQFTRNGRRPT